MGLFSFLKKKTEKPPVLAAVVLAAGGSTRMGGEDKQRMLLDGLPVLARTLLAFQQSAAVTRIVVVTRPESMVFVQDICREWAIDKVGEIVAGGDTRRLSALAGVKAAGECDYIAIHDGARPLVTPALIERVFAAARQHKAAIPGVAVSDTIKRVDRRLAHGDLPPRDALVAVQTPQIFDAALIRGALAAADDSVEYTDDAAAVEAMGMSVFVTDGDPRNIKITHPSDLAMAEALLEFEEAEI